MNVVIVGNGLAGTMAAKTIRDLDDRASVVVFAAENRLYYPRPNLIEFIAGRLPEEKLYAFPADWAAKKRSVLISFVFLRRTSRVREIAREGAWAEVVGKAVFG